MCRDRFTGDSVQQCDKSAAGGADDDHLGVLIVDSFSLHTRAEVRDRAAANNVELVFLPTYSP
ncbi:hypothetical protein [Nocardia donostiensis]|uniref:hypothetical protein n=1 Tax=Nocardia donostiensis TaxID=1538463 RepID=UPI001C376CD5|nr:hypothetical protein [Nocardia donostiensis]